MADDNRVNVMQVEEEVDQFSENTPKSDKPENTKISDEEKIAQLLEKRDILVTKRDKLNAQIDKIDWQIELLKMNKEERDKYEKKLDAHCKIIAGVTIAKLYKNSIGEISKKDIRNALISAAKNYAERDYFEKNYHA